VTVAEARTESKASQRLHISQSALSRQVTNLEQEFGLRLFERIGRRLALTPVGEQLIEECRHLLGQAGMLSERVRLMRRGDAGVLKVAAPPQTIESVLSTFLVRYAKRFPNVSVQLFEALGRE
jgi:LysR family transcriptional regulator, nitrogen assimilation regulatory protein